MDDLFSMARPKTLGPLADRMRPRTLDEFIGQKHIVRILQNQLRTDTVSQAYLFAGTHGTGKTSTARILAKAVNCTGGTDNPPCGKCDNCEAIRERVVSGTATGHCPGI